MAKAKQTEKVEDDVIASLEERFGKGTILKASERKFNEIKHWCPSGSLTLDMATGGKGIPKDGKTTCILGKEGSSKTTLALHIIGEEQKQGGLCAFLDVEGSIDLEYAESIGVDLSRLHLIDRVSLLKSLGVKDREIISGEEWLELLCKVLDSNVYEIVVFDSVAALIPMAEITTGLTGGRLAGVASMMSKAYRAVNASLSVSKSGFVYLNQYRMNPGGYVPLVEPGGEAWKYLQVLKIEISKSLDKDGEGDVGGIMVKGKITKSKVCIPYKRFEYYVEFGLGIVKVQEIIDLSIANGNIEKAGAWYVVDGNKLQGEDKVKQFLLDNPDYMIVLENKIKNP